MNTSRIVSKMVFAVALATLVSCGQRDTPSDDVPSVMVLSTPSGPGSFSPNLSSGAAGPLVLSWLEPSSEDQHALRYSVFDGSGWRAPSTVTSGANWFANWADFPSVVPVSGSVWGAHWLVRRAAGGYAYDIHATVSNDAGKTWGEAIIPHDDNTDTEHGFVSMFADDGGIGMVWLDGRKFVNEVTDDIVASGMTLRAATLGADGVVRNDTLVDELICDCCQTDAVITPEGPLAVYRNRTEGEIRDIYVARRVDDEWRDLRPVSDDYWEIPGCPVNGPVVQSANDQVAVTWFSAPNEKAKIQVAWSTDSGSSFGAPIEVASDRPRGHVGAALSANGDLVVSWQRHASDGGDGTELCLRRVSADGTMGDVQVIEEAAGISAFSVPQIASHGDDIVLAWTTSVDDSYAIHTAVLPQSFLN